MHPPLSMVFFTPLAGTAQGLALALVGLDMAAALGLVQIAPGVFAAGALLVFVLCAAGLAAATGHLGHPMRAWRSAAMWRTSWLSREVIVLPAFMAAVALWGIGHWMGWPGLARIFAAAAGVLAIALYICTGMIYAAIKAIPQWAHPITPVNYLLLGLASGLLLASALAAAWLPAATPIAVLLALVVLVLGAITRGFALQRNLGLKPRTTLQTAIGVRHPRIEQRSQGAMGGSFNTREFFHGRSPAFVLAMRWTAVVLGFLLPALVLALALARGAEASAAPASAVLLGMAFIVQFIGLLAERWSFFAEGTHMQNLYYQRVS